MNTQENTLYLPFPITLMMLKASRLRNRLSVGTLEVFPSVSLRYMNSALTADTDCMSSWSSSVTL